MPIPYSVQLQTERGLLEMDVRRLLKMVPMFGRASVVEWDELMEQFGELEDRIAEIDFLSRKARDHGESYVLKPYKEEEDDTRDV